MTRSKELARSTKAGLRAPVALPVWRLMAVSAVALTTANCAQNPQKLAGASSGSSYDSKYGVKASPRLYQEGDVIPKGGGRRFAGKPYVVAGRTYVPREDAKGYVREGLASWYGAAFHGRMTANGEVFDRHSIAAAHPTLPLPSYVRVTNVANGRSMIVRVNDRGPYHANRLMDVSEEVAQALEFHNRGTAKVRVEYVGKASTAGSDDRKLLATLRTDGEPASVQGRAPVMMADLGPDTAPSERLSRAAKPALAFRPEGEEEPSPGQTEDAAPAARPLRAAPVLVAGAANVAVPPALQPTAAATETFRPVRPAFVAPEAPHRVTLAAARPPRSAEPLALAPPPMRLASADPERAAPAGRMPGRVSGTVSGMNPSAHGPALIAAKSHPDSKTLAAGKTLATGKTLAASKTLASSKTLAALKPSAPPKATAPERTQVAARVSGRSGVALVAEARPRPMRMAAATPIAGVSAPARTGVARIAPQPGRPGAARPTEAPLPVASKAAPGKPAHATGPAKPARPTMVAATKPGPAARHARIAEAN